MQLLTILQTTFSIFEKLNSKTNFSCHFECKLLSKTEGLPNEAILQAVWAEDISKVQLSALAQPKKVIASSLQYWFFRFLSKDENYYLEDVGKDFLFSDAEEQKNYTQEIVQLMWENLSPLCVQKVHLTEKSNFFFACEYECYMLENEEFLYILFFSWSD